MYKKSTSPSGGVEDVVPYVSMGYRGLALDRSSMMDRDD